MGSTKNVPIMSTPAVTMRMSSFLFSAHLETQTVSFKCNGDAWASRPGVVRLVEYCGFGAAAGAAGSPSVAVRGAGEVGGDVVDDRGHGRAEVRARRDNDLPDRWRGIFGVDEARI